ncbi:MAG: DUF1289 domain-containing protein [Geminicoccaceae bacterium]
MRPASLAAEPPPADGSDRTSELLPSPCVGICRLDAETGWCLGCARTAEELTLWSDLPDTAQLAVWRDLPRRKALLGLSFRLLPWQGAGLLDWLAEASSRPGAAWSIGAYGAVAELMAAHGGALAAERAGGSLVLRTAGGALALAPPPGVRAFELTGRSGRIERVVLALHRVRLRDGFAAGVAELGPDEAAIDSRCQHARLFDLGLGLRPMRFCVRTAEPRLAAVLRAAVGADALAPTTGLVPHLLAASPDRVVTSPVGRIEVGGPIQRTAPSGPHTHLLPALLAQGRLLEPGFALPEGYLPCATLVPGS